MSDLISRQDVDKAIRKICDLCGEDKKNNGVMCGACNLDSFVREFDDVPSAEPERKKGKWIEQDDGWDGIYYECSECREAFTLMDGTPTDNLYNFCPHCGADMRGE